MNTKRGISVNIVSVCRTFVFFWLPPILFVLSMFFLSTRPDLRSSFTGPIDLFLRKSAHISEYFVLTLLLVRIGTRGRTERHTRIAAIILASLGAFMTACFDEKIQSYIPGRVGSLYDIAIDTFGIVSAAFAMMLYYQKTPSRKEKKE